MLHGAVGFGVGVAFLFFGLERGAPAARGAYGFRPLLLPGAALAMALGVLSRILGEGY